MSRLRSIRSIGLAVVLGVGAAACSTVYEFDTSQVDGIFAPERIVAGTTIEVDIDVRGSGPVDVDVIDAFSTTTVTVDAQDSDADGRISIWIPPHLTEASGVVSFRAVGRYGDDVATSMLIVPAAAVDPVDVIVGPRTIIADAADQTMAIGFTGDEFGNPLLDGTPVGLTLIDENADELVIETSIEGGIASSLLTSGTVAQRIEVYASVDDNRLSSRRVGYNEVPSPAADVEITVPSIDPDLHIDPETGIVVDTERIVADGRSVLEVRTSALADRFGNGLIDGRIVRLETRGPEGTGQLTGRTIDGVARFDLVAPSRPGLVTLRADVDGASSPELVVEFSPAVSELPVQLPTTPTTAGLDVSIGPVRDHQAAVVVDGTLAEVAINMTVPARDDDGDDNVDDGDGGVRQTVLTSTVVQLIDGRALATFDPTVFDRPDLTAEGPLSVTVTVLGVATTVEKP